MIVERSDPQDLLEDLEEGQVEYTITRSGRNVRYRRIYRDGIQISHEAL